ncbi:MAG: hypothetical protein IT458_12130 [Planctomycetes bacterium]|nr:hypothetical protein [Planctomycetota bacterium]
MLAPAPALAFLALAICQAPLVAQNSGARLRTPPSALAARAGTAVQWRADLAAALVEAKEQGRPVFWYVPTVQGSPMDRKDVIDRYMMAGPFSWPEAIALLNRRFVPVRAVARGKAQQEHGLVAGRFVEPGYVVLGPDGKEVLRQDRITTLQPDWFLAPLRRVAGEVPAPPRPGYLEAARREYAAGRLTAVLDATLPESLGLAQLAEPEALWLRGAALHRTGHQGQARTLWRGLTERHPESPLAWKAAMELEGHGPFVRGFEDYLAVADAVLAQATAGSMAPPGAYDEAEVRRRGVRFLLALQGEDGGFTDSNYDFGGTDSLPNVYVAGTAIAGIALLEELQERPDDAALAAAVHKALAYVSDDAHLNPQDRDEIVWAHAYRVRFAARCRELRFGDATAVGTLLQRGVAELQALQPENGAWFHEYPNPFATATVLVALAHAESVGAQVDGARVQRGLRALLRCRARSTGAFSYGMSTPERAERTQVVAAAGRMPLCELALHRFGESKDADLQRAVQAAFEHHQQLERTRKYDDHAAPHAYGGFFFWYDLQGRSEAILRLPAGEARERAIAEQRRQILAIPEVDGCFTDSHELGRSYGTASALWCLAALRRG